MTETKSFPGWPDYSIGGYLEEGRAQRESEKDNAAVDSFAAEMKRKLAVKRAEGRGGWHDPEQCSPEFLSELLRDLVEKGDPLDVGNLAMMLHQRGERISKANLITPSPDLYGALARAERTFRAMCEAALATGLEGTKEWDIIAGGADIFGAIDEVQAALSKARGERK